MQTFAFRIRFVFIFSWKILKNRYIIRERILCEITTAPKQVNGAKSNVLQMVLTTISLLTLRPKTTSHCWYLFYFSRNSVTIVWMYSTGVICVFYSAAAVAGLSNGLCMRALVEAMSHQVRLVILNCASIAASVCQYCQTFFYGLHKGIHGRKELPRPGSSPDASTCATGQVFLCLDTVTNIETPLHSELLLRNLT